MARRNSNLGSAHRGYEYQDLATAYFMASMLARQDGQIIVDRKVVTDDRFDDVALIDSAAFVRRQFKRSDDPSRPLRLTDFTYDSVGLRLDCLVRTHVNMGANPANEYRLCATWKRPEDEDIKSCLEEVPGIPSFEGHNTCIFRLTPEKVWPAGGGAIWSCLRRHSDITREAFLDFADRFRIELECPSASGSLQTPGVLEGLLTSMLGERVGIGRYPNQHLSPRDAGERLARRANAARSRSEELRIADLETVLGVRKDYGRVAQSFPVDKHLLVRRSGFQDELIAVASGAPLTVLTGPPGSGKSWSLDLIAARLRKAGHVVAQHYCYLEPGDPDVELRVTTKVLYGNLISGLVDARPELRKAAHSPYSAGSNELRNLLPHAVSATGTGQVFLLVDGIDHISRVLTGSRSLASEETDITEELAALPLPPGVHLIIGTQPGEHLKPLADIGLAQVSMLPWDGHDIQVLAEHTGVTAYVRASGADVVAFLEALNYRADGNPLYATYLCRELLTRSSEGAAEDPIEFLHGLPDLTGDIAKYYEHLLSTSDTASLAVARLLAASDFGVRESELRQILEPVSYTVPRALSRFAPVLTNVAAQGGLRIYHESFRRYVLEHLRGEGIPLSEVLAPLIRWLEKRGFLDDSKAFRFLLPLYRRAGWDADVLDRTGTTFVADSVAAGHPFQAIAANLDVAVGAAADLPTWPALVRYAQLRASLETCFREKLEADSYGRTFAAIRGADALAERLLFDGRPTVSRNLGLVFCSICDEAGAIPPWREYLILPDLSEHNRPELNQTTVALAEFHGRVRLGGATAMVGHVARFLNSRNDHPDSYVRGVVRRLENEGGVSVLSRLLKRVRSSAVCRPVVEAAFAGALQRTGNTTESARVAERAMRRTGDPETMVALLIMGVSPASVVAEPTHPASVKIGIESGRHYGAELANVRQWLACVAIAARLRRDDLLQAARAQVNGEGWYREWLRFGITIAELEAKPGAADVADQAMAAFHELARDTSPFRGVPRACDLYGIHPAIHETIARGLSLLADADQWNSATESLLSVSVGTTTYLQGSPSGPLVPEALAALLLPFVSNPDIQGRLVTVLTSQVREAEAQGEYYEVHASQEMLLARALSTAGRNTEAREHWQAAAQYLCAHGFRKDPMLFELTDSLPVLARHNMERACACLASVQPLTDAAVNHTDGKTTRHLPNSWFKALAEIDPCGAAEILSVSLSRKGGRYNWVLETALADLVAKSGDASALIRAHLLATLPAENDTGTIGDRVRAVEEILATKQGIGALHLEALAAQLQDDAADSSSEAYDLVRAIADSSGVWLPRAKDSAEMADGDTPSAVQTSETQPSAVTEPITLFEESSTPLQAMAWLREHRLALTDSEGTAWPSLAVGFADRLARFIDAGREDDALRLSRFFAREIFFGTDAEPLALMAEEAARRGKPRLAATLWTFAFTRSRGGGGWQVMGGEAHVPWLARAYDCYRLSAERALAAEVADLIRGGRIFGITENLISALASLGGADAAFSAWQCAFDVLAFRLPELGQVQVVQTFNSYDPAQMPELGLDEALFSVLVSRIHQPELKRKTAAVVGCMAVLRDTPGDTVHGLRQALLADSPLTSVTLILGMLRQAEHAPYHITSELRADLEAFLAVSHFGIRYAAHSLLVRAGCAPALEPITPSGGFLLAVSDEKSSAALSLDRGERVGSVAKLWPPFGDEVAAQFDYEWNHLGEGFRRRATQRRELARNNVQRRIPETPMLFWEGELFDKVLHTVAAELPSKMISAGRWRAGMEGMLLDWLMPRLELVERHWYSQVCRPPFPLPVDCAVRGGDPEPLAEEGPYNGWYRCGYYETQLLLADGTLPDVVGEAQAVSGIVFSSGSLPPKGGYLPFGRGSASAWVEGSGRTTILIAPISGPLVGLHLMSDLFGVRPLLALHPDVAARCGLSVDDKSPLLQLVDAKGEPAARLRVWSAQPLGNEIGEEHPILSGCDLVVRPDIFQTFAKMGLGKVQDEVYAFTRDQPSEDPL